MLISHKPRKAHCRSDEGLGAPPPFPEGLNFVLIDMLSLRSLLPIDPSFLLQCPCPVDQHMPFYWEGRWGARNQLFGSQHVESSLLCQEHPPPHLGAPCCPFLSTAFVSGCSSLCLITLFPEEHQPRTGLAPGCSFLLQTLPSFPLIFLSHSHKRRCLSALSCSTLLPIAFSNCSCQAGTALQVPQGGIFM